MSCRRFRTPALVAVAALLALAPAATAATISGTAYQDLDRDAVHGLDEPALADQQVYLFDAAGTNVAAATTDAAGHYAFSDLVDGDYRVAYASPSWWALRDDWVPTTTGSLRPSVTLRLSGAATADFGWRRIVRSTDPAAPVSSYRGPSGLLVSSYDDVVPARELHDALAGARIGAEAPYTEVRFDLAPTSMTAAGAARGGDGIYRDYSATCSVTYLSWLESGDRTLTHEYGHAWSLYNAYINRQDPALTSYVEARGLAGDPRVGSSYAWDPREMVAEDYRQLFGSANARGGGQINGEIPLAKDVPGLADFLANAFSAPPAQTPAPAATPSPTPTPTPTPTATPTPAPPQVTALAMGPDPVKTTGTVTFSLSAPASVSVRILNSQGALVRALRTGAATAAGTASLVWDRKDGAGRRVGKGSYRLTVDAVDAAGGQATASRIFSVTG